MAQCKISRNAREDLRDIYRHILVRNPSAADRLYLLFRDKFRILAENPLLGEKREDLAKDIRIFTASSYVIAYRPIKNGAEIARVVHGSRDLAALWTNPPRPPG
jgi:toxin ParE1/3/4